jgi:hypothetical protein
VHYHGALHVQEVNGKSLQSLMAFLDEMKKSHYIDSPSQAAAATGATHSLSFYLLPAHEDLTGGDDPPTGGTTILPRSSLAEKEKAPHIIPLKRISAILHTSTHYSRKGKVGPSPPRSY